MFVHKDTINIIFWRENVFRGMRWTCSWSVCNYP